MTYEFLLLAVILNADAGLAALTEDSEREVLEIGLNLRIVELATDEMLSIENAVR